MSVSPAMSTVGGSSAVASSSPRPIFASVAMQLAADYAMECLRDVSTLQPTPSSSPSAADQKGRPAVLQATQAGTPSSATPIPIVKHEEVEVMEGDEALLSLRVHRLRNLVDLIASTAREGGQPAVYPRRGAGSPSRTASRHAPDAARCDEPIVAARVRYGSQAAAATVGALHDCLAAVSGASPRLCGTEGKREGPALTALARPVTLPEATLTLYAANTKTVFRRRPPPPQQQCSSGCDGNGQSGALKRQREDESPTATPRWPQDFFEALAEKQRKQRFAIYTSRTALLPRVDALVTHLRILSRPHEAQRQQKGKTTSTPSSASAVAHGTPSLPYPRTRFVSPAVRQLAALNLAAERAMLGHTWAVRTCAMLLVRLPALYAEARRFTKELAAILFGEEGEEESTTARADATCDGGVALTPAAPPAPLPPRRVSPYFRIPFHRNGVVRVCVQHGLAMDVTYDLPGKQWTLLRLHWNIWAPLCAVCDDTDVLSIATAEPERGLEDAAAAASERDGRAGEEVAVRVPDPSVGLRCLMPNHSDAMARHVQFHLTEGGLEGGCVAANQLLCTTVMDVVAAQARRLQATVFGPPLPAKAFAVEVRQGTHVALIAGPPLTSAGDSAPPEEEGAGHARGLMMQFRIAAGTVVVEKTWTGGGGGSSHTAPHRAGHAHPGAGVRTVRRVLEPRGIEGSGDVNGDGAARIVVDVEGMLWDSILGDGAA